MGIIKKLWWFFKLEKRRYSLGIIALILVSVLNLIPPKAIGRIIDAIATNQLTKTELWVQIFYLLVAAFSMYALRFVWRRYILGTSYQLGRLLRLQLFTHFTNMSPSFYQKYRTGDLMAHATNDINALQQLAGGGVMSAIDGSFTLFVTLITMLTTLSWELTLVAIIPFPLMILATNWIGRKLHTSFRASQAAFSELNNYVQENIAGMKVTKSFGYQSAETTAFQKTNENAYAKNMQAMMYNNLFDPMAMTFVGTSYVLTLWFGGQLIAAGKLTVGDLVTFITYLNLLVWPLQAVGWVFNLIQRGSASYARIEALLANKSDVQEVEKPIASIQNGTFSFEIGRFAYTQETENVLENIVFQLKKGETLGIVGPTGSGKTTLLRLLLRERDVTEGVITLNGENIREYRLHDLRGLFGYVPQDQVLFATTIRDNVRFGDMSLDDEAVKNAMKICGVYKDVMDMPDQLDTIIGERGVSLSGGQKQRIAMSRAFILDPEVLILDDSLSAVDARTEHHILENLKRDRQDKTTIITAHRLSAVAHADHIIVLQNGTITEHGTHEALLAEEGWYYQTYQSQQLEEDNAEGEHYETV